MKWILRMIASLKGYPDSVPSQGITSDEINIKNSTSPYWIGLNEQATWYQSKLVDIMQKYAPLGVVMGHELLLRSDDTLRLANDLEKLGIAILGFDCWYNDHGGLREDTSVEFYVGDTIIWGSTPVHDSAVKVNDFIQNQLPKNTQYVSLTLHIPYDWKLFAS